MERFWDKVQKSAGCWLWTAHITADGYGRFRAGKKLALAHRFSYELAGGIIPPGLEIDHTCKVRACVNPAHLEVVTRSENNKRSIGIRCAVFCPRGHLYGGGNLYVAPDGARHCRTCRSEAMQKYRAKLQKG